MISLSFRPITSTGSFVRDGPRHGESGGEFVDRDRWASVLLSVADTKFHLGDRLVEVGVSAPELQSALVCIAFAQAELGHARLLYNWVAEWRGAPAEITGPGRAGVDTIGTIDDWIPLMVVTHMVNVAVAEVTKWLCEDLGDEARQKTAKMAVELREHIAFSGAWCRKFHEETGAVPRVFEEEKGKWEEVVVEWLTRLANIVRPKQAEELVEKARMAWRGEGGMLEATA